MAEDLCREAVTFTLDDREVEAAPGETIWEIATRLGAEIPHLCHSAQPGYAPDGNCRACMVEIEGERTLAASCIRRPVPGMVVKTQSERASRARRGVLELLLADQPERTQAHDASSEFWRWADQAALTESRFPRRSSDTPLLDDSHVAMRVNLDACIHCNLCVRACRDVQANDVIGMAGRGFEASIIFDQADPMGASTCVACGECVQACPTGALTPATMVDADQRGDSADFEREVRSVCPYCGVGCQLSFKLKPDPQGVDRILRVDGVDGPANEQRLCVKGRFGFDYIAHPHRLTQPLIRKEGAPKGLDVDPANPFTHFRPATWDEALDAAASGLAQLADGSDGRAIAGFGSAKCSNEEAYLFQKLIRQRFGHNNVDHCTRLCHASSVAALMEGVGSGAVTATFNEIENAEVAIVIGSNPMENHPVAATYFKQFAKRGGKLIVMDPRRHGLSRYAHEMVQFRAGADVAMLNAILHTIVEEGLTDQDYIAKHTSNYDAMRTHLAAFAPEDMAELCGVEAERLRAIARTFATSKASMIFWGMGVSQHTHGTDNARCLIALALMTGHVGRPGTGLHPLRGQNNVQGASDAGLIPMVLPDYRSVTDAAARAKFSALWGFEIDPQPGYTVVEILERILDGDVRGMYILGENPAMSDPDLSHAREALAKLEHLVVQDIFLTETAMFADVVLPASAWPEKNGTVTNTNRQVQMGRKALEAPGQAREDWRITTDLARRLGLDWDYEHPRDVFAEMTRAMPSLDNISWDRLERENAVGYPSLSPDDPGQPVVFGDRFPREGGKAWFAPAQILPPAEAPDAEYPMVLTTGRQLEHWHTGTMTRRASTLDSLEPEPTAALHPETLARLNVAPGEFLMIKTRRGTVTLKAREDRAVAQDMVFIPFAYTEAPANMLTNPALDPYGKIPEFKFAACSAHKADKFAVDNGTGEGATDDRASAS
ncbi:MAG: formate dehydrogenase subunit alpha [Neomegalonema sp.]|nr:formate dehydrogenase subunit alpha [Neomegalonema sp.]